MSLFVKQYIAALEFWEGRDYSKDNVFSADYAVLSVSVELLKECKKLNIQRFNAIPYAIVHDCIDRVWIHMQNDTREWILRFTRRCSRE